MTKLNWSKIGIFFGLCIMLLPLIMIINDNDNFFINICGILYLFLLIAIAKAWKYRSLYKTYKEQYEKSIMRKNMSKTL